MKTVNNDRKLIEDFLPLKATSAETSREESIRKCQPIRPRLRWAHRPVFPQTGRPSKGRSRTPEGEAHPRRCQTPPAAP